MALGNNRKNDSTLIILKLKTADAEKKPVPVHFEVTKKVDDKWQPVGETKDVSGRLTKVETYEREWEGTVTPLVKIYLEDDDAKETYLLDLRYNMLSRNLFNSLLSLDSFEDVKIGVWDRKKDDKTYPAVTVRQGEKMVDWKHKIADLPPVEKVKVGKKDVTNFDNLNDFFIEELKAFADKVKATTPVAPKASPSKSKVSNDVDEEVGDSEIPF